MTITTLPAVTVTALDNTPATWLPAALPDLNAAIVRRAFRYIGIEELAPNRSGLIDEWNRRAGAPIGSPWCASFATAVWEDCGADVPRSARASCDVLMAWGRREGLWLPPTSAAQEGALVLYGVPGDASHVGILARRVGHELRDIEGNTSYAGFGSDGVVVTYKPVKRERLLGFVVPRPAPARARAA